MQAYRADFAPIPSDAIDVHLQDAITAVMGDVSVVLSIAKGPKLIKQGRLGLALLKQERVA
jgi:hypothetical protein